MYNGVLGNIEKKYKHSPIQEAKFVDSNTGQEVMVVLNNNRLCSIYYLNHNGLKTQYTKEQLKEFIRLLQEFRNAMEE